MKSTEENIYLFQDLIGIQNESLNSQIVFFSNAIIMNESYITKWKLSYLKPWPTINQPSTRSTSQGINLSYNVYSG